jgi:hypothetical protein
MKYEKTPIEQIEIHFENTETITQKELFDYLQKLKDYEKKVFIYIHQDGKNTILSNQTSNDSIKRLFSGLCKGKK